MAEVTAEITSKVTGEICSPSAGGGCEGSLVRVLPTRRRRERRARHGEGRPTSSCTQTSSACTPWAPHWRCVHTMSPATPPRHCTAATAGRGRSPPATRVLVRAGWQRRRGAAGRRRRRVERGEAPLVGDDGASKAAGLGTSTMLVSAEEYVTDAAAAGSVDVLVMMSCGAPSSPPELRLTHTDKLRALACRPAGAAASWASSWHRSTDCDSRGRAMSVHATASAVDAKCRRRSIRAARCVHAMSPATPPRHCTAARPGQPQTSEMKRSSDCSDICPPPPPPPQRSSRVQ